MDVIIEIAGVQQADGETERVDLVTDGAMKPLPDGYELHYTESAVTGMEGVETTLRVQPGMVTLTRSGAQAGILIMEHKKRHMCNYDTPYGSLMLGVFTDSMHQEQQEERSRLALSYTLDIDGGLLSHQKLLVQVTPKEG